MILGAIVGFYVKVLSDPTIILIIGGAVICYNIAAGLAVRRDLVKTARQAQVFWLVQILADMIALTVIVYYTGGIKSPVAIFYVVHMFCAGLFLSARFSYAVATVVVVLFGAVVGLQAAFPTLYHPLGFGQAEQYYYRIWFVAVEFTGFAVAVYASAYLTTTIIRRLPSIFGRQPTTARRTTPKKRPCTL